MARESADLGVGKRGGRARTKNGNIAASTRFVPNPTENGDKDICSINLPNAVELSANDL